ncbi:hypothetical protein JOB18_002282 [Solea senegalensis]|uniref:Uncharacterized protein n=1 Tax=Solea senegalensis TaxID=28829 RepID=A0AAV6SJX1_SOLSE|nr:hypothetical protein JOB18_002282 [Solea senegalensis]
MAAPFLAAETCDSAAVPTRSMHSPAAGVCAEPAGTVAATLPSHLHKALHCVPRPAGSLRQSGSAAVVAPARGDAFLVDGGGGL